MWIMTIDGFISIVDKGDHEGYLCVRSREYETLERVLEAVGVEAEIRTSERGDYAHRIWLTHDEVSEYLAQSVQDLNYFNFKSEVQRVRGKGRYLEFLSEVWSAGWSILR